MAGVGGNSATFGVIVGERQIAFASPTEAYESSSLSLAIRETRLAAREWQAYTSVSSEAQYGDNV